MQYAIIVAITALLICPMTVRIKTLVSLSDKKIYYSIFLFGKIRVNSGYVSVSGKFAVVNYCDKKAHAVELKKFFLSNISSKNFLKVEFLTVKNKLILGELSERNFIIASAINIISAPVYSILKEEMVYLDFCFDVIFNDENFNAMISDVMFAFNFLVVTEILLSKIVGGILVYAKRKFGK